jgi:hypothetical protein
MWQKSGMHKEFARGNGHRHRKEVDIKIRLKISSCDFVGWEYATLFSINGKEFFDQPLETDSIRLS